MSSDIFNVILNRKIDSFVKTFVEDSSSIFYKGDGIIHPGEYGKYREQNLKELIRVLLSKKFGISDGFIITSSNKISTQCDIVIYKDDNLPILHNDISQFYTIENTVAIGEVKSDITISELKKALKKLSDVKKLADERMNVFIPENYAGKPEYDMVTFLVCKKINGNVSNINFNDIYAGMPYKYRHNVLLSIEDGIFIYDVKVAELPDIIKGFFSSITTSINFSWEYPIIHAGEEYYECTCELDNIRQNDFYHHIKQFLHIVVKGVENANNPQCEMLMYSNLQKIENWENIYKFKF